MNLFKMINEIIEADKQEAEQYNIQTATEARQIGYEVACTVCGSPTCFGEYTHYES